MGCRDNSRCAIMPLAIPHVNISHLLASPCSHGYWLNDSGFTKRKFWFIAARCSISSQHLNIEDFTSGRAKSVSWAEGPKAVLLVYAPSSVKEDKCGGTEIERSMKEIAANSAYTGFTWGWKIWLIFFIGEQTMLCFRLVTKTVLVTYQCFSCCWTVFAHRWGFLCFSFCPLSK